ncbi:hypothetical protein BWQ96_05149 [Gracilariopsis chorda]|uniref:Putative restriction endonuclease domain-containing protein n=1 Tax=Gracilariopsis chorda TaxID=448386 RepID=A0A2V3IVE4_9FLOR|nr:hypothetical protein BWQ96_05149 [Gracilariopsis chorda]|eukprot:PXF45110.1 hypothetical protein BWQ96_05149 [Gracilariopsis chorda]
MEQLSSSSCFISEQLMWRSRISRGGAPLLVSKHPTRRFTIMPRVMCLHSAASSNIPRGLTVEEYHELIETGFLDHARGELIDGFFIQMHPQSPRHSKVVKNLNRLLVNNFSDVADIGPGTPISLSDGNSEPEPDMTLSKQGVYDHPEPRDIFVVMEVSNSSLDFDSTTKLIKYATSGIPEYWLIDVNKRTVRILRNPQGNRFMYDEVFFKGRITLAAFPKKKMDIGDIFLGLPAS